MRRLRLLRVPVVARVNGVAVGAGCDLALACDLVVASEHAKFGQFWVRRGLVPDLGAIYIGNMHLTETADFKAAVAHWLASDKAKGDSR